MKIYLSGPISEIIEKEGLDKVKDIFEEAEKDLSIAGLDVVNPMKNGIPSYESWGNHMEVDIKLLRTCDAICFLQTCDLYKSDGVDIEKIWAKKERLMQTWQIKQEGRNLYVNKRTENTLNN